MERWAGGPADLRALVTHFGRRDEELRQRLSDAVAAVAARFEEQVLLLFENFAVLDKGQQQQLLQRETHQVGRHAFLSCGPSVGEGGSGTGLHSC